MKYYDLLTEAYYNNQLDPMAEKVFEEMETERLFGIKDTGDIPSYRRIKKNFNPFEEAPEPARTEPPKQNQPYYPGTMPGYQLYGQPVRLAADMTHGDNRYVQVTGMPNSAYGDNNTGGGLPDNWSDNITGGNQSSAEKRIIKMIQDKKQECDRLLQQKGSGSPQYWACGQQLLNLIDIYKEIREGKQ